MARNASPGGNWPPFRPDTMQGINIQDGSGVPGTVDYSMCAFWDKIAAEVLQAATENVTNTTFDGNNTTAPVAPYTGAAKPLDGPTTYVVAAFAFLAIGTACRL